MLKMKVNGIVEDQEN